MVRDPRLSYHADSSLVNDYDNSTASSEDALLATSDQPGQRQGSPEFTDWSGPLSNVWRAEKSVCSFVCSFFVRSSSRSGSWLPAEFRATDSSRIDRLLESKRGYRGRRKLSFVRLTSVLASPSLPGWSFVTSRNSTGNGQPRSWTVEGYTTFKDSSRRTWNVSTIDDYCKNQRFDLYSIDSSWIFQDGPTVVQLCAVMLPAWLTSHREKLRSLHKFHAATS